MNQLKSISVIFDSDDHIEVPVDQISLLEINSESHIRLLGSHDREIEKVNIACMKVGFYKDLMNKKTEKGVNFGEKLKKRDIIKLNLVYFDGNLESYFTAWFEPEGSTSGNLYQKNNFLLEDCFTVNIQKN
jgi:hypothetical protein